MDENIEKSKKQDDAQARILKAATNLFSQKGYDATRVNEIADKAGVNKALIYYYFKNKAAILDNIINSLMKDLINITMKFINNYIVKMIIDNQLDIKNDRLSFATNHDLNYFLKNGKKCYEEIIDYSIKNHHVIKILLAESLKTGKYNNKLFYFMDFLQESKSNPIYNAIIAVDKDLSYSNAMIVFHFFFSLLPIFNFAAFYNDLLDLVNIDTKELRKNFLQSYKIIIKALISGNDILLKTNN